MKRYILLINSIFLLICNIFNIWVGFSPFPIANLDLFKVETLQGFVVLWFVITVLEVFLLLERGKYNFFYIPNLDIFLIFNILHYGCCLIMFMWYYSLMMGGFHPN